MNEEEHLLRLANSFSVTELGEGDPIAGVNQLVAMAASVASLAPPGSGILISDQRRLRAGTSLLVSGSLSASLVTDSVTTELGITQNHLTANLRRLLEDRQVLGTADDRPVSSSEQALFNLQQNNPLVADSTEQEWMRVLKGAPKPRPEDLAAAPKIVVVATRPEELQRQLGGLQLGRPLVLAGLSRTKDLPGLGEHCTAVLDGLLPDGNSGESVKGNLLVTDPSGLLRDAAQKAAETSAWLGRLVWLVDGSAGPELPEAAGTPQAVPLDMVPARFGTAVLRMFARRLDNHDPGPAIVESTPEVMQAQIRWVRFLKTMETSLPGISGTARTLFASLYFGLHQLVRASRVPKGFKYSLSGIEAFARFLVRRMANARAAMVFSAKKAWELRHKRKILAKLADSPLDTRTIYRHLSIPSDLCEDLLRALEADGLLRRTGREWERLEGGTPASLLTLEVS